MSALRLATQCSFLDILLLLLLLLLLVAELVTSLQDRSRSLKHQLTTPAGVVLGLVGVVIIIKLPN
jgi:hypothetical protein